MGGCPLQVAPPLPTEALRDCAKPSDPFKDDTDVRKNVKEYSCQVQRYKLLTLLLRLQSCESLQCFSHCRGGGRCLLNSALCLNQSSSSSSAVRRRRLPTAPATRRSSRPRPRRRRSCSALNCDVPSTMPPPPGLLRGVRTPPAVLRLRLHSPPAAGAWPPRARESVSTQYKATRSTRVTRTPGMGLRARRRPRRRGPRQASRGGRASHRVPRAHRLASPTPATWHTGPPHGLGRQLPIGGQRSGARRSGLGESLPWRGRRTHSPRHLRGTRRAEQQSPSLSQPRVKQSRRD